MFDMTYELIFFNESYKLINVRVNKFIIHIILLLDNIIKNYIIF